MTWDECSITVSGEKIPTFRCLEIVFERILTIATSLAVLALFVMILVGGFKYLTSGGDQKATASAQQTITFALMGIGLMLIAFLVFKLIEYFTGVQITIIRIPQ